MQGGWRGCWCWDSVLTRLTTAGVGCFAIHLPGSGADSTPTVALPISDSAAVIIAAIDGLPAGPGDSG